MMSRRQRWWNVIRFDAIELAVISLFFGLVIFAVARSLPQPRNPESLAPTYGPDRYSENEEEWAIRDFFKDRRNGFFVDVGAAHYRINSNTYYLERNLGWKGLAIEPFRHYEADYVAHRPGSKFLPFFVADKSDETITMYTYGENFLGNSSDKKWVERFGKNPKEIQAKTITLDDLFALEKVSAVDFLSIDIELAEPRALAGLTINRFRPALVCIEAHPEVRQQILDYFARNGYVVVGKYLRSDPKNLYFTPYSGTPGK
jgi:FkbM family methyltransferase